MSCKGWKEYKIDEVYKVSNGLSKKREEFGFGYEFLAFTDVFNNYFVPKKLDNLVNSSEKEREKCSIKRGDVFLTRTSEKLDELGRSCVALKDYENATFNGFTKRLRPKGNIEILPEYAGYYFRSPKFRNLVTSMSSMTTRASLNNDMLSVLTITVPPVEEQQKIANILSSLDDKIELNNEMNKTLEEMAQSLFKRWFIDFEFPSGDGEPYNSSGGEMVESELGMIPKGWEVGTLDDIATVTMGVSPKSSSYNTENIGVPLLNGASDFNSTIIKPTKHTTEPKKMCKKGEMVFCIRATIGNLTFADRDYCIGRGVASVQPKLEEYRELIYFNINRSIEKLISQASGSVFSNLTRADINNMTVIIPTNEVLDIFSSNTSNIIEKVQSNNLENEELISIRENLLPKLMSRKLKIAY
ncbi:restriction endonuclease subunit S [Paeniclostridium sordellii]|nr:restriction endonuclease subunit S [Paeniclostridium sordellii]MSB59354.1 restriction endonuclease subunit S [Paeniclostridium sordellii]